MKILFIAVALGTLGACSKAPNQHFESFPNYLLQDVEWITYEGVLPLENGQPVMAELHLVPGTPGMDSYYRLKESFDGSDASTPSYSGTYSTGKYSVLFGSPDHNIIQIISKQKVWSVFGKGFTGRDPITEDLYLKSYGDHELILVDENFREVVPGYSLIRRSELFTVEGYFTVYGDTTEFFERNTRKTWPVARLAYYDEAVKRYNALAKEKFEGVYLNALSYSVSHRDKRGNESAALVFKNILDMDSTTWPN